MQLRQQVDLAIDRNTETAEQLVRFMYEHPETAKEEILASSRITELLKKKGFAVEYPYLQKELGYGTAFRAVLENGSGPKVAILVEYDALPELGHGCGHNLHGALSTLASLALFDLKEQFQGTLYVIGTPAEEGDGAKLLMSELGIFDAMDLAVMMHSCGAISYTDMDALSLRCYELTFHGQQSHAAAAPWAGHNALTAARKFLDLVDARRESLAPYSIFSAVIKEGGIQANIIPDYAMLHLEFRSKSRAELEELNRIVKNCASAAALAMDCTAEFKALFPDFYDMVRIPVLEEEVHTLMQSREEEIAAPERPSGSTDMGNVSYRCPSIQPMICITKQALALHTAELRDSTIQPFAIEQMKKGAAVICELTLKLFHDKAFCTEVRKSFETELKKKEDIAL